MVFTLEVIHPQQLPDGDSLLNYIVTAKLVRTFTISEQRNYFVLGKGTTSCDIRSILLSLLFESANYTKAMLDIRLTI